MGLKAFRNSPVPYFASVSFVTLRLLSSEKLLLVLLRGHGLPVHRSFIHLSYMTNQKARDLGRENHRLIFQIFFSFGLKEYSGKMDLALLWFFVSHCLGDLFRSEGTAYHPEEVLVSNEESHQVGLLSCLLDLLRPARLPLGDEEVRCHDHGDVPQVHAVPLLMLHHLPQKLQ